MLLRLKNNDHCRYMYEAVGKIQIGLCWTEWDRMGWDQIDNTRSASITKFPPKVYT